MSKRFLLFLFLFALSSCDPPITPTPITTDTTAHLVIVLNGQLQVKRNAWSEYAPARFGTIVRRGDLLRLGPNSQATLVCADLTLVAVTNGDSGVACPVTKDPLIYNGVVINETRGVGTSDFPVIIAPRTGKLLNPQPLLRWTQVGGAISYHVAVREAGTEIWSTDVDSQTEIIYPVTAPKLTSNAEYYKVIVKTGSRSSEEEAGAGLTFQLLKPDEAKAVRALEQKIRVLNISDAAKNFLIANLYATQELNTEAIEQLDALSKISTEPAVARMSGDLFFKVGLNEFARDNYDRAFALAQQANDVEGQALAQVALGRVYDRLGLGAAKKSALESARNSYQRLGDTNRVKKIQDWLNGTPISEAGTQP